MTLPATLRRSAVVVSNGTTTLNVPFSFKIDADTDIQVQQLIAGDTTTLVLNSGFTVIRNLDQIASPGGVVTLAAPGVAGARTVVIGNVDYSQPFAVPTSGSYKASLHEGAFDRMVTQIQQLDERASRTVQIPAASDIDPEQLVEDLFTAGSTAIAAATAAGIAAGTATAQAGIATTAATAATAAGAAQVNAFKVDLFNMNDVAKGTALLAYKLAGGLGRSLADKLTDLVSVKDYGAIGDGNSHPLSSFYATLAQAQVDFPQAIALTDEVDVAATDKAIAALNNGFRSTLYFPCAPGYKFNRPTAVITNKRAGVIGDGPGLSIIDSNSTTGFAFSIINNDFYQRIVVDGLTIKTRAATAKGLYAEFSVNDATNNRTQTRLTINNVEFQGEDFVNHAFNVALELNNVHQAVISNVNIIGRGNSPANFGTAQGVKIYSTGTGAPSDIVFHNVRAYGCVTAFEGRGHLEGVKFDHCFAINVVNGWDFQLSAEWPWFSLTNSHSAFYGNGVNLTNFSQSYISNNLLYNNALTGTGVGINLTNSNTCIVTNNEINCPTSGGSGGQLIGINVASCSGVKVANNKVSLYNAAYQLNGSSDNCVFNDNEATNGLVGSVIYNNFASGTNNKRRATPSFFSTQSNGGAGSLTTSATTLTSVGTDIVEVGDVLHIVAQFGVQKDATPGKVQGVILQASGSATFDFGPSGSLSSATYVTAGSTDYLSFSGMLRVTQRGSCNLALQGYCGAGAAALGAGYARLTVKRD